MSCFQSRPSGDTLTFDSVSWSVRYLLLRESSADLWFSRARATWHPLDPRLLDHLCFFSGKGFLNVSWKTWPRRVDANLKKAERVARFLCLQIEMFDVWGLSYFWILDIQIISTNSSLILIPSTSICCNFNTRISIVPHLGFIFAIADEDKKLVRDINWCHFDLLTLSCLCVKP